MGRIADLIGTLFSTFRIGKGTVDASAATAARSYALQDKSGTLAMSDDQIDSQYLDANLEAFAALVGAANKIGYFTGPGAMNLADFTVFARLWCALADAGAGRTLLELGTAATRNATTSATDTTSERLWRTDDLVKQTSQLDTTSNRVLLNGAYGFGAPVAATDMDTVSTQPTGFYSTATSTPTFTPPGVSGINKNGSLVNQIRSAAGAAAQAYQTYLHTTTGRFFYRAAFNNAWIGSDNGWKEFWTTGNFDPDTKTNKTKVITPRTGTSYTFVLADNIDVYNRFTNAGASTCTVPPDSSVAFPIGHVIVIRRAAAANLTLTPGAGVTLKEPALGSLVMTDGMTAELIKVATDTWDVVGQTVAA